MINTDKLSVVDYSNDTIRLKQIVAAYVKLTSLQESNTYFASNCTLK